ncbi:hypothetical protein [Aquimarina agarilytica]|uniref:hypothetical protein n=1 Tax=Aquimarina agarilytica TaxID=1087449 RepID=UPI0002889427|nr:hypothetical protein [Aquimarina agarilytica]
MLKLFLKIGGYLFLILIVLEVLVRIFHLAKDTPKRFIDEAKVEKWIPNQKGIAVTGNRKQNHARYRINNAGFNSYQEYTPTKEQFELALVGDSFIQGFHQDYTHSIGKKIENALPAIKVYEYAYAGYDFADQLHLIHAYKKDFDLIDQTIIYIDFNTDLLRGEYAVIQDRIALQSPLNNMLKKCKLLVYTKSIGVLDPPKNLVAKLINSLNKRPRATHTKIKKVSHQKNNTIVTYLNNFKKLVTTYGFDKKRYSLLLNTNTTPKPFLDYLMANHFKIIDFHQALKNATAPTYLIYDQHWNDYGRTLIANQISKTIIP